MKTKNKAFTLAETLVVMGIIGVIAALTIPNLSQSTGNREAMTKFKKTYAELGEAIDRATAIYGPVDTWFTASTDKDNTQIVAQRIMEFMKIQKDCKFSSGCLAVGSEHDNYAARYKFLTGAGCSVVVWYRGASKKTAPIQFYVNPNGLKKLGDGIGALLYFTDTGMLDAFCRDYTMEEFVTDMTPGGNQWCGSRWILEYDNMDFKKIDADWKCTNGSGKVLNLSATPPVTSCN